MRYIVVLAAALAAPAAAHEAPPSSPTFLVTEIPPVDTARLAMARRAVDSVWPLGTYARMMNGQMRDMMESMTVSMLDMRASDAMAPLGADVSEKLDAAAGGKTMRELMAQMDPHFAERLDITNRVMLDEMTPIMSRLEPSIREGLARAYARRFSTPQLEDLNRFFATPSGAAYASDSMLLFVDPEVVSAMAGMMPEMMKAMPDIMKKVRTATAHLPPPPRPRHDPEE